MSRMTDFTVPSTVPGRTLHAFCCEPEGEVRAVLQLRACPRNLQNSLQH